MDSQEHAESSSSPSAKIISADRQQKGRYTEGVQVVLSDASSFFVPDRIWQESGFSVGDTIDWNQVRAICLATSRRMLRERALSLLANREHSRHELLRKLCDPPRVRARHNHSDGQGQPDDRDDRDPGIADEACNGIHRIAAHDVVDALSQEGLQSDIRFAQSYLRRHVRSLRHGRAALIARLTQRGVSNQVASETLDQMLEEAEVDFFEAALEVSRQMSRRGRPSERQLAGRLSRRGFEGSIISRVLERYRRETQ